MRQYRQYIEEIFAYGEYGKNERTGVGCYSLFGQRMLFDMGKGFPLVSMKYTSFKMISTELCWFLRGDTNVKWLQDRQCHIWDEWADGNGDLGPVYGAQWRDWLRSDGSSVDQFKELEFKLGRDQSDRAMIVSAWNVGELDQMSLRPCHLLFQCHVRPKSKKLDLQVYQRSCDSFLGVPYNIASYALLLHILALRADLIPGQLIWVGGDCHIYENHLEQCDKMLSNECHKLPTLAIAPEVEQIALNALEPTMFSVKGYTHGGSITAPVAV